MKGMAWPMTCGKWPSQFLDRAKLKQRWRDRGPLQTLRFCLGLGGCDFLLGLDTDALEVALGLQGLLLGRLLGLDRQVEGL